MIVLAPYPYCFACRQILSTHTLIKTFSCVIQMGHDNSWCVSIVEITVGRRWSLLLMLIKGYWTILLCKKIPPPVFTQMKPHQHTQAEKTRRAV
jgi:hypothetical protein